MTGAAGRIFASPYAKTLAAEKGISLQVCCMGSKSGGGTIFCRRGTRDSFRKISKGGTKAHQKTFLGEGGRGAHIVGSIQF